MRPLSRRSAAALAVALLASAGCGDGGGPKSKVTGTVSFNGKPVSDGYIVFRPTDGKGSEAGGPIVDGNYIISVSPGPKTVTVTSSAGGGAAQAAPMTSEEASKMKAPDPKKAAENITADAKGNNAKVEVKPGDQSFDFALKSS